MRFTDLCPECARPTEDPATRRSGQVCPHCGSPLVHDVGSRWVNVARVTNLAEAGFIVDELAGEDIRAQIYQSEDFSALADRWVVSYLIQSPPADAQAAAARIRQHLSEIESYQEPISSPAWQESRPTHDSLVWRPMALVILAGVASFAVGQRFAVDRDPRPQRNTLSGAVTAIGRPLVTEPAPGMSRHRLYYHWRERSWYLETDGDDDGLWEGRLRFHATGSRW